MSEDTISPMQQMLLETEGNSEVLGERIAGVLEFLTVRAAVDAPYIIYTDDEEAMTLIAAGESVKQIVDSLPEDLRIKRWEDPLDMEGDLEFLTDADPGDEQDEPAAESE